MNAPVNLNPSDRQALQVATGLALDKKRYWWLLSPGLPVIGMGILAGYYFGPKSSKTVFALGGPLFLHVIIPVIDAIVGADSNNPSDKEVSALVSDRAEKREQKFSALFSLERKPISEQEYEDFLQRIGKKE